LRVRIKSSLAALFNAGVFRLERRRGTLTLVPKIQRVVRLSRVIATGQLIG
jgi:hypothetical protein